MLDDILLPIDLQHSDSWEKALPAALQLVGSSGTLHLLGIVPDIGSSMVATYLPTGYEKKMLESMNAALRDFAAAECPAGITTTTNVGHGHVAETIIKHAKRLEVDAIVMGSHKPDDLRSLLISSHANAVVRHSPISVMIIR